VVLGANGILYVMERVPISGDFSLVGLQRSDGNIVVDQDLTNVLVGLVYGVQIYAYSGGLVIVSQRSVNFLSYAGQLLDAVPTSSVFPQAALSAISVSLGGDVFLSFGPGCDGNTTPGYLARIAPDGSFWSKTAIPSLNGACSLGAVTALPDGGVAYAASGADPYGYGVTVYNADGSVRWHDDGLLTVTAAYIPISAFRQVIPPTSWHVDSAGHLIGLSIGDVFTPGSTSNYVESTIVWALNSSTGSVFDQSVITAANDLSPREIAGGYLVSDQDRVYVTGGTPNVSGGDPMLWAIDVPGMTGDWPTIALRALSAGAAAGGSIRSYVALGDSYSSGEGLDANAKRYMSPSNTAYDGCHRSKKAYPELVAKTLKIKSSHVTFVACSGATSGSPLDANSYFPSNTTGPCPNGSNKNADGSFLNGRDCESGQLTALTTTEPDLITLTLGGNDLGFPTVLQDCVGIEGKTGPIELHLVPFLSTLSPCNADIQLAQTIADNNLEPALASVYEQILDAAPKAELVVLNYPQFFTKGKIPSFCPVTGGVRIKGTTYYLGYSATDISIFNSLQHQLSTDISNAVTTAETATGRSVDMVDMASSTSTDALPCNTKTMGQSDINGIRFAPGAGLPKLVRSIGSHCGVVILSDPSCVLGAVDQKTISAFISPGSFHPKETAHKAMAAAVESQIGL